MEGAGDVAPSRRERLAPAPVRAPRGPAGAPDLARHAPRSASRCIGEGFSPEPVGGCRPRGAALERPPRTERLCRRACSGRRTPTSDPVPFSIVSSGSRDIRATTCSSPVTDAAVRERLGIAADEEVCCTPRPGATIATRSWTSSIRPGSRADRDAVVLVSGHTRTLPSGSRRDGPRVIDVTAYSDTVRAHARSRRARHRLLLGDVRLLSHGQADALPRPRPRALPRGAARVLLRPLIRAPLAPSSARTTNCSRRVDHDPAEYAERYATWRPRSTALDDGHASERVVARLIDAGMITP